MAEASNTKNPLRSVGVWMAIVIAVYMIFNTWRSASDPSAFVRYFGIEAAAEAHPAFVYVYASRACFLGLVTAVLLWRRQYTALTWFAGIAIIMPLADAALVANSGDGGAIVARHVAVAAYLALTTFLLHRWNKSHG